VRPLTYRFPPLALEGMILIIGAISTPLIAARNDSEDKQNVEASAAHGLQPTSAYLSAPISFLAVY
jgi:hypothetical protein